MNMHETNMLPIEVRFKPRAKWWVASAPQLDVVTQGGTFEEAKQNLQEALMLFFESCLRRDTLGQVLADAGLTKFQIEAVQRETAAYMASPPPSPSEQCRA